MPLLQIKKPSLHEPFDSQVYRFSQQATGIKQPIHILAETWFGLSASKAHSRPEALQPHNEEQKPHMTSSERSMEMFSTKIKM